MVDERCGPFVVASVLSTMYEWSDCFQFVAWSSNVILSFLEWLVSYGHLIFVMTVGFGVFHVDVFDWLMQFASFWISPFMWIIFGKILCSIIIFGQELVRIFTWFQYHVADIDIIL